MPEEPVVQSFSKPQTRTIKTRAYNLTKVKKSKKWLKNILLDKSDSSTDEEEGHDFVGGNRGTETTSNGNNCDSVSENIVDMIRYHKMAKQAKLEYDSGMVEMPEQYRQYSTSLLAPPNVNPITNPMSVITEANHSQIVNNAIKSATASPSSRKSKSKAKKKPPTFVQPMTTTTTTPSVPLPPMFTEENNHVNSNSSVTVTALPMAQQQTCSQALYDQFDTKPAFDLKDMQPQLGLNLLVPKLEPKDEKPSAATLQASLNLASVIDSVASNFEVSPPESPPPPLPPTQSIPIPITIKTEPELLLEPVNKRMKLETPMSMVDEIVYDTFLPDEILQSEVCSGFY